MVESAEPNIVLEVRDLHKSFEHNSVLRGVGLAFREGRILGLMGENGAGKSTLMKICAGILNADTGTIEFDGKQTRWANVQDAIEQGIAFIHQELSVFPGLSVSENIFINPAGSGAFDLVHERNRDSRAKEALARVGADHIDPRASVGSLSIADRQSVEIARVLAGSRIKLLIMDEPTSALTRHEAEKLFERMRELASRGVSIIFISHRFNEIIDVCDEIVVLRDGVVVGHHKPEGLTQDQVVQEMVGRDFESTVTNVSFESTAPVAMRVDGLGDGRLVRDVSLDLRFGEVLGIYGLVGSGRTELLRCLIGQREMVAGHVEYFDGGGVPHGAPDALKRGIVMVPENRKTQGILPNIEVGRNITYGVLSRLFPRGWINERRERAFAEDRAGAAQVRHSGMDQPIRFLSGGNQQKTILARAMAAEPKILLLDEPTLGVDVNSKFQIYETIAALAEKGTAILMVSSELPEVMMLSSRILVMSGGRQAHFAENRNPDEVELGMHAFRYVH